MIQPRRNPQQSRSKVRVETILDAARELIGEQGCDAISVRAIAAHADVPISSIYQYFPDKNAIMRRLMEIYLEQFREVLKSDYESLHTSQEALAALLKSGERFFQFVAADPAFANIWAGVQASPILRLLDIQDSEANASFLTEQLTRFLPTENRQELFGIMFFFANVVGDMARLALYVDEPARAMMIREVKILLVMRLKHFFGDELDPEALPFI